MIGKRFEPIVALCSPRGSGAVALLRLAGDGAVDIASGIARLSSKKLLTNCATHTIEHGYIVERAGKTIDEVLFLLMRAPRTFTGCDTVEITCHNNPFLIDAIIARICEQGGRLAQRGEFTQMAFLNGKMDLLQAESLHEVITGQTEQAVKVAMAQLQGTLSAHIAQVEQELVQLLCLVEASFEFLDEEQRDLDFDVRIIEKISRLRENIAQIVASFNAQEHIRSGVRIALVGTVNAGKSTLFNALLGKDRAIVTDKAGTTRDSIEASIYRDGNFWTLVDTAGLRETDDHIEQAGIERTYDEAARADIILLVQPMGASLCEQVQAVYAQLQERYHEKIIQVHSKVDLASNKKNDSKSCAVSVHQQQGIAELEKQLAEKVQALFAAHRSPFLLNIRQQSIIKELCQKIEIIEKDSTNRIECELVAYHLRDALSQLSSLTGKSVSEKMLDTVFRSFCVGK